MDFFRLRLSHVPADTSLVAALDRLLAGTRAVVVDDKKGPRLVTADDIMEACNTAADSGKDPASIPVTVALKAGAQVEMPEIPLEAFERELRHDFERKFAPFVPDDVRYTMRRIDDETDFIVTASETLQLGQSITICTCVGNPVHRFNKDRQTTPGKCIMPHGATTTCKTV
jgi:hypothetical protein